MLSLDLKNVVQAYNLVNIKCNVYHFIGQTRDMDYMLSKRDYKEYCAAETKGIFFLDLPTTNVVCWRSDHNLVLIEVKKEVEDWGM